MNRHLSRAALLLAGVAIGALSQQALHAQAKPPAYVIGEIDIRDAAGLDKEYVPPAAKVVIDGGGRYLARGDTGVSFYGAPPKRLAIMQFESVEKAEAAFRSKAYTDAKLVGDKYATFRVYMIEGLLQ
ncbi:MAG: DUF1330 domain-containing protein [Enhydrobacter sp.]